MSSRRRSAPADSLRAKYLALLAGRASSRGGHDARGRRRALRSLILMHGMPEESAAEQAGRAHRSTLRGAVWALLLGVPQASSARYVSLVERGASAMHDKVMDDVFRTFPNDKRFLQRVSEGSIIRVLNAFVHQQAASRKSPQLGYVQGMNVLCAPLLYTQAEPLAFASFSRFITQLCPRYVLADLRGVHDGCALLDEVLSVVDPKLAAHLSDCGLTAKIYGFPLLLSLGGCTPPLEQLLRLWDVLFAFGVQLTVLFAAAQVVLLRKKLLTSQAYVCVCVCVFVFPRAGRCVCVLLLLLLLSDALLPCLRPTGQCLCWQRGRCPPSTAVQSSLLPCICCNGSLMICTLAFACMSTALLQQ
eukprot:PLAT10789.2.p1 GENE.PLAT10789.2~~PLAT10789.2.p1  ORF type:complete len:372 (-),score=97.22 PLAT10789.2:78-1157(-)